MGQDQNGLHGAPALRGIAGVYPGSRVTTSRGDVATVAWVGPRGDVWGWVPHRGVAVRIVVRGDAFGGEMDQAEGLGEAA